MRVKEPPVLRGQLPVVDAIDSRLIAALDRGEGGGREVVVEGGAGAAKEGARVAGREADLHIEGQVVLWRLEGDDRRALPRQVRPREEARQIAIQRQDAVLVLVEGENVLDVLVRRVVLLVSGRRVFEQ